MKVDIFLDDGGVMNDNERRSVQWQRLVGEFFAPRLGGAPEAWAAANRVWAEHLLDLDELTRRMGAAADYASFDRLYQIDWLRGMAEIVGVSCPTDDECLALAHEANRFVTPRVRAAFAGAVEAIRALHARGHRLHTASGEPTLDLVGYLEGMGVRHCFDRLYGPDRIDTFKTSPRFYERLLADAGVDPASAVIVDDNPRAIAWAAATGARTVHVTSVAAPSDVANAVIGSLAELPDLLAGWLT